jgi:hypothetical protein
MFVLDAGYAPIAITHGLANCRAEVLRHVRTTAYSQLGRGDIVIANAGLAGIYTAGSPTWYLPNWGIRSIRYLFREGLGDVTEQFHDDFLRRSRHGAYG